MLVLVVNCGSTTVKSAIIDTRTGATVARVKAERLEPGGHAAALGEHIAALTAAAGGPIEAVGHRVVHGGEAFSQAVRIDDEVEARIESLIPLAPLHNPANLAGIRAARSALPELPHVAVFDTAFHATLPRRAATYAIDREVASSHGVRRYGFHGTSHGFVAARAAAFLDTPLDELRIITCHLGGGCSIAAVEFGRSVETSMGMTPLEGLMMGTRSGDIDAGVLVHLLRSGDFDADSLDTMLNKRSGLAGFGSSDMRDMEERAEAGDDEARLAISVFTHRVRKYIGAYAAAMGGVDAIVFTAGIGENSALIRHRCAQRLEFLGARLDEEANREARLSDAEPVAEVSTRHSRCRILAVATDEQRAIAEQTAQIAEGDARVNNPKPIPIAVSARHIHLTVEAVATLFGEGYELTPRAPLSQPGQFACEETLDLIGPKRRIDGVRVLGPTRSKNQVEVSRTDEFTLGIDAPVRGSGDVANTPGITLVGPKGELTIDEGVICAQRHIHMTPEDAEAYGVKDKDIVMVAVDSEGRDLIYGDVLIRVSPKYSLEMHIDTDEGNAAELPRHAEGMLVKTGGSARLLKKRI